MKRRRTRGPKPPAPYKNPNPNERGVLLIWKERAGDDGRGTAPRPRRERALHEVT